MSDDLLSEPLPAAELAGWRSVPLRAVARLSRGLSWGKADESSTGVPVVAIPNIRDGCVTFNVKYRINVVPTPSKTLHKGDILLVGSSGSAENVGRCAMVGPIPYPVATFASFLVKAEPIVEVIDADYLLFLLSGRLVDFAGCSNRAADGKFNLQTRDLLEQNIHLPPLPEQRAISAVLRTVQRATQATENVIAAARQLKKSLMRHLFTHGPVPFDQTDKVELKETNIGAVPTNWAVESLGDFSRLATGGTPSRECPEYWNGDIPWVKTGEINYRRILTTEERITAAGMDSSNTRLFPAETLLVAMYGQGVTRGRVAILGIEAATNQACAAIFPQERVRSDFLFHSFVHHYERIREMGHGANQRNLSMTMLRMIEFAVPPLTQQGQIAASLSAVDCKLLAEEHRARSLDDLFRSLLHNLMTGCRRVRDIDLSGLEGASDA